MIGQLRLINLGVSLAATLLLVTAANAATISCASREQMLQSSRPILRRLQTRVEDSIQTFTPYATPTTSKVFENSYDWHSSVHAHWANLTLLRYLGDQEEYRRQASDLSSRLDADRSYLNENPTFELPYGQSWLLLLLRELRNSGHPEPQLEKETVHRVGKWLARQPFPEDNNGICRGDYKSWLFSFMLARKSGLFSAAKIRALDKKFASHKCLNGPAPLDFSSPTAIDSIINQIATNESRIDLERLGPISISNCHQVGAAITENWPTTNGFSQSSCADYSDFLERILNQPRLWKADFVTVAHWIPQFLWFGLWLQLEN